MRFASLTGLLLFVLCAPAHGGDFMDTRITVTFGDDDVAAKGGEVVPDSPYPGFGDRAGYKLMFDALSSRYAGRETLTHVALYKKMPSFFNRLTTEAMLLVLLELNHTANNSLTLLDSGSYIRLHWAFGPRRDDGLSLVAFPFDSDRFRLGYLYRISVGGSGLYPRRGWIGAPGVKLQLDHGVGSYFVGMKALPSETAPAESKDPSGQSIETTSNETFYSVLGGASWSLLDDLLQIDVGAGFFSQGENPIKDVAGKAVFSVGGTARVALHRHLPIEESIDLTLYRNDPNRPLAFFRPVEYSSHEIGWLVSVEATALAQRLADPAVYGATKLQPAVAGAVQARLQHGFWRHELTALYQDLAFMLHTTPGFVPFQAFGPDAKVRPEIMLAAATDYFIPRAHLTLGASAGVMWPASLRVSITGTIVGSPSPTTIGEHVIVVPDGGQPSTLPDGASARPLFHGRLQARIDLSRMLFAFLWVQYRHDPNRTMLLINPDLTRQRLIDASNQLGVGVSGAVRF